MYFTIYEVTTLGCEEKTGKLIKIPNALIITSPVTTFTSDNNITLCKVPYVINIDDSDPIKFAQHAQTFISATLRKQYDFNAAFSESLKLSKNKLSKIGILNFAPKVELKLFNDKDKLVNVQTSFYCFADDINTLEQALVQSLLQYTRDYKK
ncbi:hypothetical protein [Facilibium subflavum]|uniref:hypothetical protein n=1 Tax=Facilibium subflavum TaxID=2219058 RepID=UPI001F2450BB|nr:hypothetical protein [Facilibium subflavum]